MFTTVRQMVVDDLHGVIVSTDVISQSEDEMKSKNENVARGSELGSALHSMTSTLLEKKRRNL
jgi:hypothetical protein